MAGLINWKKVSIPTTNPDEQHLYVGIDSADCKLYIKDDTGAVFKYETNADVTATISAALANYDLSTVVDSKISNAINNLINGAGSALDTLNELATALGNDPNFATTTTTAINNRLRTDTAAQGLNLTQKTNAKTNIDLENVDNTSDLIKPVSGPQATAIAAAVSNHETASDPHPQYLTTSEGNSAYQPLDGDLTAIAALAGAGFAVRTTTNTWATRSLTTPPGSGLGITNQDGVFGSPAFTNTDKGSVAVAGHVAAADPHPQYETSAEAQAKVDAHANLTNNPHAVTKAQVGLGDVDNTSDLNKPISNATQTALNNKANLSGGNTFTGTQQINDGNLILRDENTGGEPYAWLIGRGGAGNKVGYRFSPFFNRTGGHAAEVGAIDDGNSSAHLLFYTAPTGPATSILERGRFNNDGSFGVGVGAVNDASALMQINSTTRGFLMPRMTTTQMEAIASPAAGLQIYNTTLSTVCTFNGVTWTFDYCNFTTTTQSTSSTTYANITELVTAPLPAGRYQVYFSGTIQSTATAEGVGLRLSNETAGVGAVVMDWSLTQAGNGTDKNFQYTQVATGSNFTSTGITVANGDVPAFGLGIIQLTTAGTLAMQIRTETGVGASCSIRANSVITYKRVSG